jgi:hypothetical protein
MSKSVARQTWSIENFQKVLKNPSAYELYNISLRQVDDQVY